MLGLLEVTGPLALRAAYPESSYTHGPLMLPQAPPRGSLGLCTGQRSQEAPAVQEPPRYECPSLSWLPLFLFVPPAALRILLL